METLPHGRNETARAVIDRRSIVLVGMMGCGKSTVGRRLAARLGLPFFDADTEIEKAAGQTIPEIFECHGEAYFRDGERRVIARLLSQGPIVLATGGGAFMNEATREGVRESGISVWLKAEPEVLMERVSRRNNRPLLRNADPEGTLRRLLAEREPVYALADIIVTSSDGPHEAVVEAIIDEIAARAVAAPQAAEPETAP
jgi:shikimate kinase